MSSTTSTFSRLAALALIFAGGCASGLDPASLLNKTRPLGVRVEVIGERPRTTPLPGESAELRILMGHAEEVQPVSFFALACVPAPVRIGVGFCEFDDANNPVLVGGFSSGDDVMGDPSFTLDIPDDDALDALGVEDELLVLGVVCAGELSPITGLANLQDADTVNPCRDPNDDGALFTTPLFLQRNGRAPNLNPAFREITIDGMEWTAEPADDATLDGCGAEPIPQITNAEPVEIELRAGGMAREEYEIPGEDGEPVTVREELQVTLLATAGEMEQTFSFLDDNRDVVSVGWLPSVGLRTQPTRVRFEFVMRDLRGGVVRARREACVTRP